MDRWVESPKCGAGYRNATLTRSLVEQKYLIVRSAPTGLPPLGHNGPPRHAALGSATRGRTPVSMVTIHARTSHRPRAIDRRQTRRVLRQKSLRAELVRRRARARSANDAHRVPRLTRGSGRTPFPTGHPSIVCHSSSSLQMEIRPATSRPSWSRHEFLGAAMSPRVRTIGNEAAYVKFSIHLALPTQVAPEVRSMYSLYAATERPCLERLRTH